MRRLKATAPSVSRSASRCATSIRSCADQGASRGSAPGFTDRPNFEFTCSSATAFCARSAGSICRPRGWARSPARFARPGRGEVPMPFDTEPQGKKKAMESQSRILVTGATGFIGSQLCDQLVEDGFDVHCIVRNPDSDRALELEQLGCELHVADLTRPAGIAAALEGVDTAYFLV